MDIPCEERLRLISGKLKTCRKALSALGDETRQAMLLALLESDCDGVRVGEIARKTHLSRPAVSHHLQILKDAEIVNMRREGTKNYYYLDSNESQWKTLYDLVGLVYAGVRQISGEDPRGGE